MALPRSKRLYVLLLFDGDFYFFICLRLFRTKTKLESHKKLNESKYFCCILISSENTQILEFNQHWKSDKRRSIIHADIEFLIKRIDGCKNIF